MSLHTIIIIHNVHSLKFEKIIDLHVKTYIAFTYQDFELLSQSFRKFVSKEKDIKYHRFRFFRTMFVELL
jgi:hypothetical protein